MADAKAPLNTRPNHPQHRSDDAYRMTVDETLARWQTSLDRGLHPTDVDTRLATYGQNVLEDEKKTSWVERLLDQFKDFMILILIVAALVSGVMGEVFDAIIIVIVIVINAVLGVIQEGKAEKAIEALQKMSAPKARVVRDGQQAMINASHLVPGDVVVLDAGDVVPADLRLAQSVNLKADEAALTGESVPVEKDASATFDGPVGLGDRITMVFSGTAITYGHGLGIVVATGHATEMGKIADRIKGIDKSMTPLQANLNQLGKVLGILCLAVCAVVFGVGLLQGGDVLGLFLTAVSLAVAAIPEGLPAVVTIVLAIGMGRMASRHAIVRRLLAVETLGSVDTICSDKTGTLTQNEMTVTTLYADRHLFRVSGTGYAPSGAITDDETGSVIEHDPVLDRLLHIAVLCNDARLQRDEAGLWTILGDPTEGAMLTAGAKGGVDHGHVTSKHARIGGLPFDSNRKMMSVFHDTLTDALTSLTKGAPDIVLARSSSEWTKDGVVPLSDERRSEILAQNRALAQSALRVLAFAYKEHATSFDDAERDMTFVGLMGMIDPARPEAREAISVCKRAGIRPVMITGDYKDTAVAIADDLGLREPEDKVLTGVELDALDDESLDDVVDDTNVYARVSPEHKVKIVAALKRRGHIASMTGDGVNDAPALKQADIGVAMGITGTEVSKGSSDMILTDDNFATIVSAVEEGRTIYGNIRKAVSFLLSCNVGEILVIFISNLILGPNFTPLVPVQLLWMNLVTDSFPALALGRERSERDIMLQKPRNKRDPILDTTMRMTIAVQAVAIFIAVFTAFQIGRWLYPDVVSGTGQLVSAFHLMPLDGTEPSNGARTFAFIALIMSELLRAFSSRSEKASVFTLGLLTNATLNRAFLISLALTLAVIYVPFLDPLFHTVALTGRDWGFVLGLAVIPFIVGEGFKAVMRARAHQSRARR